MSRSHGYGQAVLETSMPPSLAESSLDLIHSTGEHPVFFACSRETLIQLLYDLALVLSCHVPP